MKNISALTQVMIVAAICLLTGCSKENPFMKDADSANNKVPAAEELLYAVPLSPLEIELLEFVREEEKMARDVYYALSEIYKKPVFKNIMKSEQEHMDRILCLLIHYEVEDPASDQIGEFSNQQIQELYDDLIDLGTKGIINGLTAGAYIEDFDIDDINYWISQTSNEAILEVLTNIVCGSGNHLISFSDLLNGFGVEYTPSFISEEEYQAILDAGTRQCGL